MLYHLFEMQHATFAPARFFVDHARKLLKNPYNPLAYSPLSKTMLAGMDIFEQTTRRYGKPQFNLNTTVIDGLEVKVTEEVLVDKSFCSLLHFKRDTKRKDPKVLVIAPLSGHYATLLTDTVKSLLPDHDVYITDWKDARDVPMVEGSFDLDDFIDYIIGFLQFIGPKTHVIAVCQPSVPALAATAIMAAEGDRFVPASLTLMGGPIDTSKNPTEVNTFATSHSLDWFKQNVIVGVPFPHLGALRKVYPGFLQLAGFLAMNLEKHMDAHWEMFEHLVQGDDESAEARKEFYGEYRSVMDMTEEFYLQTIKQVFLEYHLPRGLMVSRGRVVDPAKITKTALMTVEGELDDISGIGQTKAAHTLCSSLPPEMKSHYEQKGVGHYGIFHGRKWRGQIAPRLKSFIAAHK